MTYTQDPWDGYDAEMCGADALYSGSHEIIGDVREVVEVCLRFEAWAENFRWRDRRVSALKNWHEESNFSEAQSIRLATTEVGRDTQR